MLNLQDIANPYYYPNYQLIISDETLEMVKTYHNDIIVNHVPPGDLLDAGLKREGIDFNQEASWAIKLRNMPLQKFIEVLYNTKKTHFNEIMKSEDFLNKDGGRFTDLWTKREYTILSRLTLAVWVTNNELQRVLLLFSSPPLEHNIDKYLLENPLNSKEGVNQQRYNDYTYARISPAVIYANALAKQMNKNIILATGGMYYSDRVLSQQKLKIINRDIEALKTSLERIKFLDNIATFVYNGEGHLSLSQSRLKNSIKFRECNASYAVQPKTSYFSDAEKVNYNDCLFAHFVPANPFSLPGDGYNRGTFDTREAKLVTKTNLGYELTGVRGNTSGAAYKLASFTRLKYYDDIYKLQTMSLCLSNRIIVTSKEGDNLTKLSYQNNELKKLSVNDWREIIKQAKLFNIALPLKHNQFNSPARRLSPAEKVIIKFLETIFKAKKYTQHHQCMEYAAQLYYRLGKSDDVQISRALTDMITFYGLEFKAKSDLLLLASQEFIPLMQKQTDIVRKQILQLVIENLLSYMLPPPNDSHVHSIDPLAQSFAALLTALSGHGYSHSHGMSGKNEVIEKGADISICLLTCIEHVNSLLVNKQNSKLMQEDDAVILFVQSICSRYLEITKRSQVYCEFFAKKAAAALLDKRRECIYNEIAKVVQAIRQTPRFNSSTNRKQLVASLLENSHGSEADRLSDKTLNKRLKQYYQAMMFYMERHTEQEIASKLHQPYPVLLILKESLLICYRYLNQEQKKKCITHVCEGLTSGMVRCYDLNNKITDLMSEHLPTASLSYLDNLIDCCAELLAEPDLLEEKVRIRVELLSAMVSDRALRRGFEASLKAMEEKERARQEKLKAEAQINRQVNGLSSQSSSNLSHHRRHSFQPRI